MIPIIIINLSLKEANSKLQKASIKKSQTQFITIEILTKLTYECPYCDLFLKKKQIKNIWWKYTSRVIVQATVVLNVINGINV